MRITQLLGRGDEDVVTDVFENARLDELKNVRGARREFVDEMEFRAYMEGHGFHCLGEGYYGMVFTHRSFHGKYVLKVFQDHFYEAFIQIAQANADNPHFPRFIGNVMRVTDTVRMVRIEVLQELSHAEQQALDGNFAFMEMRMQAEEVATDDLDPEEAEVEPQYRGFFDALCEVYRRKPQDARMDMHILNVMKRGQTLVITDPYKGANGSPGSVRSAPELAWVMPPKGVDLRLDDVLSRRGGFYRWN